MTLLKEIGAILGFVAFGGLAVLVFLTFQQARHLRRLREWAGRAPELAATEAERVSTRAAEASAAGTAAPEPPQERGPGRLERARGEVAYRWDEANRRSPVNPLIVIAALVAVIVGVGIATSGFGLLGSDSTAEPTTVYSGTSTTEKAGVEVAVLNGTAPAEGAVGVVGIAKEVSADVKQAGYEVGEVETAPSFAESVIMFEEGSKSDAKQLASDLEGLLGETGIELMTPEVAELAKGAPLALVIGVDDSAV